MALRTSAAQALRIAERIRIVRTQRVLLDADLAALYGVSTKRLNEQVRRNRARFPKDFAFRLHVREVANLRSQIATSSLRHGGARYAPLVFTEHGAIMLASVLNSPVAVEASILVVRAFVRLRRLLASHAELARRLDELEQRYDGQFRTVFQAIRQLMIPVSAPAKRIGFTTSEIKRKARPRGH